MASRVSSGVALGVTATLTPFSGGVANQLIDVGPLEGIAAGEDEDRECHVGDLVDEGLAFFVVSWSGCGDGLRGGAAVFAGQITGLGDFPDGEERGFVVIQPAAGGNVDASAAWFIDLLGD